MAEMQWSAPAGSHIFECNLCFRYSLNVARVFFRLWRHSLHKQRMLCLKFCVLDYGQCNTQCHTVNVNGLRQMWILFLKYLQLNMNEKKYTFFLIFLLFYFFFFRLLFSYINSTINRNCFCQKLFDSPQIEEKNEWKIRKKNSKSPNMLSLIWTKKRKREEKINQFHRVIAG